MTESLRALVTGGAGFIGGHLVEALVGRGHGVVVLDDLSGVSSESLNSRFSSDVRVVRGDVCDRQVVAEAVKDVDAVFHLAAVTSVPFSVANPLFTSRVNVDGTVNVLDACARFGVRRFVFASSCAVYGEAEYLPVDEGHRVCPVSPYARSKLEAERSCLAFDRSRGVNSVVLRLFNVFGPGQRGGQYCGVISRFAERVRAGLSPVVFGDGLQTRDFVYVGDVVRACLLALDCEGLGGGVFNVGSGVSTSVRDLAHVVGEVFGGGCVEPVFEGARVGDLRFSCADVGRARSFLGYEPRVGLREGLAMLLKNGAGVFGQ